MKLTFFLIKKIINLIGWQTEDVYQNLNQLHLFLLLRINQKIDNKKFKLPTK